MTDPTTSSDAPTEDGPAPAAAAGDAAAPVGGGSDGADDGTRRRTPPLWLVEAVDVLEQRRRLVLLTILGLVLVAVGVTLLWPTLLPTTALVGASLGLAAALLGVAAAIATDAADTIIRGPRHVAAAGGELVAVLPVEAHPAAVRSLADAVVEARPSIEVPLLLGLATAGQDRGHVLAWSAALARALAATGASVLHVDLATGRSEPPGLLEVLRSGGRIGSAVRFEPGLRLAWLGAGADRGAALDVLGQLRERLPSDLDVLLVALPPVGSRQVLTAASSLDHLVVVAERDRTARVDLIAGLDAMEAIGAHAQVLLLDDRTARLVGPATTPPGERRGGRDVADEQPASDGGPPDAQDDQPPRPSASAAIAASAETAVPLVVRVDPTLADEAATAAVVAAEEPEPDPEPEPEDLPTPEPEPEDLPTPEPDPEPEPEDLPTPGADPDPEGTLTAGADLEPDDTGPVAAAGGRDVAVLLGGAEARAIALADSGQLHGDDPPTGELRAATVLAELAATTTAPPTVEDGAPDGPASVSEDETPAEEHDAPAEEPASVEQPSLDLAGLSPADVAADVPTDEPVDQSERAAERPERAASSFDVADVDTQRIPTPDGLQRSASVTIDDEELLRTTARLAVLLEDLDRRDPGA